VYFALNFVRYWFTRKKEEGTINNEDYETPEKMHRRVA
jgi:hypothetical protein